MGAIIGLISLILMLTRPDRKTIQDLVAGTVVLYDPNKCALRVASIIRPRGPRVCGSTLGDVL